MSNIARSLFAASTLAVAFVASDALAAPVGVSYKADQNVTDLSGLGGDVDATKVAKVNVGITNTKLASNWTGTKWNAGDASNWLATKITDNKWAPAFKLPTGADLPLGAYTITVNAVDKAGKNVGTDVVVKINVIKPIK